MGRFLQTDPVEYEDVLNRYQYVENDPLNAIDPNGRWTIQLGGNAQAVMGVGGGYSVGIYVGTTEDGSLDAGLFHTAKIAGGEQLGLEAVLEVGLDLFGNQVNVEDLSGTNIIVEGDFIGGASLEVPADGGNSRPSANPSRTIGSVSVGLSEGYALGVNSTETVSFSDIASAIVGAVRGAETKTVSDELPNYRDK